MPKDVRERLGKTAFVASTAETDDRKALHVAKRLWAQWGEEIAAARDLGAGPILSEDGVKKALESWRRRECEAAATLFARPSNLLHPFVAEFLSEHPDVTLLEPGAVDVGDPSRPVRTSALGWAQRYFAEHLEADRSTFEPAAVQMRLVRLRKAAREADGWVGVPGLDTALARAVADGGGAGTVTASVREKTRLHYALGV